MNTARAATTASFVSSPKGGRAQSDGERIVISDAGQVLLLIGIEWHETREEGSVEVLKRTLDSLPGDYRTLLALVPPLAWITIAR